LAREALLLSENVGRLELIARNCMRLARALARQDVRKEDLPHAQRAVAIFTQSRSKDLASVQAVLKECEDGLGEATA